MDDRKKTLAPNVVAEATLDGKTIQWWVVPPAKPEAGKTVRLTLGDGAFLAGSNANPGSRVRAADEIAFGTLGCWCSVLSEKGFFFITSEHIFREVLKGDLMQFSRNGVSWVDGAEVVATSDLVWEASNQADAVLGALIEGASAGLEPLCTRVRFSSRTMPAADAVKDKVEVAFCGAVTKPGSEGARGRVVGIGPVTLVQGGRKAEFKDHLFVEARGPQAALLAVPGDSGSLVVVSDEVEGGRPIGLLIGWFVEAPEDDSDPVYYYVVTPIESVFLALKVDPKRITILG